VLAHSIRDVELDADTVSLIKSKKTYYIPTLELEESFYVYAEQPQLLASPFFQIGSNPKLERTLNGKSYRDSVAKDRATEAHKKAFEVAMKNARKLRDATALLAFGTDSGANPYRVPGFAEHRELQLLVQAGLTPLEAIRSATQTNAQMLHLEDRTGTIQTGKQADLVVLDGDPSKDISNTEKIAMIFHNGRRVERESPK
jgi:imidazolonepropionase-like amidohydrolase